MCHSAVQTADRKALERDVTRAAWMGYQLADYLVHMTAEKTAALMVFLKVGRWVFLSAAHRVGLRGSRRADLSGDASVVEKDSQQAASRACRWVGRKAALRASNSVELTADHLVAKKEAHSAEWRAANWVVRRVEWKDECSAVRWGVWWVDAKVASWGGPTVVSKANWMAV